MSKSGKSLPPWLQDKGDDKGKKAPPKKMANGGAVGMYAATKPTAQMAQRGSPASAAAGAGAAAQQMAQQRAAASRPAAPAAAAGSAMAGMKRGAYADGGKVAKAPNNKASMPKKEARSDPKLAGNAKGNVIHLKNGGKAKAC